MLTTSFIRDDNIAVCPANNYASNVVMKVIFDNIAKKSAKLLSYREHLGATHRLSFFFRLQRLIEKGDPSQFNLCTGLGASMLADLKNAALYSYSIGRFDTGLLAALCPTKKNAPCQTHDWGHEQKSLLREITGEQTRDVPY